MSDYLVRSLVRAVKRDISGLGDQVEGLCISGNSAPDPDPKMYFAFFVRLTYEHSIRASTNSQMAFAFELPSDPARLL